MSSIAPSDIEKDPQVHTLSGSDDGLSQGEVIHIDTAAERSYVRKLDTWLLPFLTLMCYVTVIDRSNLANSETAGLPDDLHFRSNEYSLLILLFYIPFGLMDLPLNLLTRKFSARIILPILMVTWGILAMLQVVAVNFGGLLAIRLLLGTCEAGLFCGVVYYLTLFYTRDELGFRMSLFFSSSLLAAASSGLISYGMFRIHGTSLRGWQWLMLLEGLLTTIVGIVSYFWIPTCPEQAWFLTDDEKTAGRVRMLRDSSTEIGREFHWRDCFAEWKDWKFPIYVIGAFCYPITYFTTSSFLPQIVELLDYSGLQTNLWTVAPNLCGFVMLLLIARSSDHLKERTLHMCFALLLSLIGVIILLCIDVTEHQSVAYFAIFLMVSGSYVPPCLFHSWHNNNNLNESSRAATSGILIGIGDLSGVIVAGTFRTEFAPKYNPTLILTATSNGIAILCIAGLGLWMKMENHKRNKEQGVRLRPQDVPTSELTDGERSPRFRYYT